MQQEQEEHWCAAETHEKTCGCKDFVVGRECMISSDQEQIFVAKSHAFISNCPGDV